MHFSGHALTQLLSTYGYWAVFAFVGIEAIGIPFPGEAMLVAASVYAGTTHNLDIAGVIAASTAGAVLGDNIGFWIGREFGFALLLRIHHRFRLDERKLKLGQYMFMRFGGKVVFFGRFVAALRIFAALLAGINQMSWRRFLIANCAGGLVWSAIFGIGGYIFGKEMRNVAGPLGIAALILAVVALAVGFVFVRRNLARLEDAADAHFPGPLQRHVPERLRRSSAD